MLLVKQGLLGAVLASVLPVDSLMSTVHHQVDLGWDAAPSPGYIHLSFNRVSFNSVHM